MINVFSAVFTTNKGHCGAQTQYITHKFRPFLHDIFHRTDIFSLHHDSPDSVHAKHPRKHQNQNQPAHHIVASRMGKKSGNSAPGGLRRESSPDNAENSQQAGKVDPRSLMEQIESGVEFTDEHATEKSADQRHTSA